MRKGRSPLECAVIILTSRARRKKVPAQFEAGCRFPQRHSHDLLALAGHRIFSAREFAEDRAAVGGIAVSTSTFFYREHCPERQSGLDVHSSAGIIESLPALLISLPSVQWFREPR